MAIQIPWEVTNRDIRFRNGSRWPLSQSIQIYLRVRLRWAAFHYKHYNAEPYRHWRQNNGWHALSHVTHATAWHCVLQLPNVRVNYYSFAPKINVVTLTSTLPSFAYAGCECDKIKKRSHIVQTNGMCNLLKNLLCERPFLFHLESVETRKKRIVIYIVSPLPLTHTNTPSSPHIATKHPSFFLNQEFTKFIRYSLMYIHPWCANVVFRFTYEYICWNFDIGV